MEPWVERAVGFDEELCVRGRRCSIGLNPQNVSVLGQKSTLSCENKRALSRGSKQSHPDGGRGLRDRPGKGVVPLILS